MMNPDSRSSAKSVRLWDRLSPSCRAAFAWALSLDPGRRVVYSENLLLGLIQVHPTSNEPTLILDRYGSSTTDLESAVTSISTHHLASGDYSLSLDDLPNLSRNTRAALDEAVSLSEIGAAADGVVHVPHLFGGLLAVPNSYAYRALEGALGPNNDLSTVAARYIGEFLPDYQSMSLAELLRQLPDTQAASDSQPAKGPRPEPRDQVEWIDDAPTSTDLLDRQAVAGVIAGRLKRMNIEDSSTQKTFLIHIDGPWGSGKSSLLEFLRERLADHWLVVPFDAWRQSRLAMPWWSLLMAMRRELGSGRRWDSRLRLTIEDSVERARRGGAPYLVSILLLVIVVGVLFAVLKPSRFGLGDMTVVAQDLAAIFATLATLFGGALLLSRFMLWDSAVGARLYEQSQKNPMEGLADHFAWLIDKAGRPVIFFIDDLDRCGEQYVVDLLEAIQTLIRDSPRAAKRPPRYATFFVVAADGAWLRRSYENGYGDFQAAIGQPGRSVGYLFLDKIFQLTVSIPLLKASTQTAYMRNLLNAQEQVPDIEPAVSEMKRQIATASPEEAITAVGNAPQEVRRQVIPDLVEMINRPGATRSTEHALTKFATLLEPNPRAMKRFLNSFAMARSILLLQDVFVEQDELALWTILRLRWPGLGDYLMAHPVSIGVIRDGGKPPADAPSDLAPLFGAEEVLSIVASAQGGPLNADKIRKCSGMSVDSRVMEASMLATNTNHRDQRSNPVRVGSDKPKARS